MAAIHHATKKKAEKFGIILRVDPDNTVVAIDPTVDPDHEYSGANAVSLLEHVLAQRPKPTKGQARIERRLGTTHPRNDADGDGADDVTDADDEGVGASVDESAGNVSQDAVDVDGEVTDEADEGAEEPSGSVIKPKYREIYAPQLDTCGDAIVEALTAACLDKDGRMDMGKLIAVGSDNGIDVIARWGHLNNGMMRMNTGNVLRSRIRNGVAIRIGDQTFQPVEK